MKTKLFRLKFEGALASGIRALDAARTTSVGAAALFAGILPGPVAAAGPAFELVGSYATGLTGQTSAEVVAVKGDKMYVSNAANASVDIVDISDPKQPVRLKRLDLSAYGSEVTSVAVGNGLVAAAVESGTEPGKVVFFSPGGSNLRAVEVGAGPDMVTFTPDGKRVLVANEGEPSGYGEGHVDPEGSVSVIDVLPRRKFSVKTIGFQAFDPDQPRAGDLPPGVRIFGSTRPSLDLEPEYIAVDENGRKAWVSLQENNAIAILDLEALEVDKIVDLGFKDHSQAGNGLDASDRDNAVNISTWPQGRVYGMYQPDGLAAFRIGGKDYVLSANEGDAREYPGLAEEARVRSVTTNDSFTAALRDNAALGRLTVTTKMPAAGSDAESTVYAFGARSFSVWDGETGDLVYDSGDQLEQIIAAELPANFNSNNEANTFDDRSDNKGPEPEAAATGVVDGRTYGFIGLERVGGVVVVDLGDPTSPAIVQYLQNRDFAATPVGPDSGPEVIDFVPAHNSPTGKPLIAVSNEVSGTVSLWGPKGE